MNHVIRLARGFLSHPISVCFDKPHLSAPAKDKPWYRNKRNMRMQGDGRSDRGSASLKREFKEFAVAHPNVIFIFSDQQLEQRLKQWMQETGDPFETGERDPETGMLCLGQKFTSEHWNN